MPKEAQIWLLALRGTNCFYKHFENAFWNTFWALQKFKKTNYLYRLDCKRFYISEYVRTLSGVVDKRNW